MDSKAGGGKAGAAGQPDGSETGEGAAPSSARVAWQTPLADDAAALGARAAAGAEVNGSGVVAGEEEEEEDDNEQVQRFYALLANIRAMRGAYGGTGTDVANEQDGSGGARKRLRGAEPPWRPAFRLEDFEEPSWTSGVARCAKQRKEADGGDSQSRARSIVAPEPRAGARFDSGSKSI